MSVKLSLNAFALKWIAMLAMTADHVAWAMLDDDTHLAESCHFVGRLVMPLMCYFLAVGAKHSHNRISYAKRLFIFAIISQLPFMLFGAGLENWQTLTDRPWHGNVLFTLCVALLALMIYDSHQPKAVKAVLILCLYPVAKLSDYGFAVVVLSVFFYVCLTKPLPKAVMAMGYLGLLPISYVLIYGFNQTVGLGYMHYGMILTLPLILLDNGQKGSAWGGRYLFYGFYPVHLFIIAMVAYLW